jgi:hypothetical protein
MYRRIFWAIAVLIAHTATSRGAYVVTFSQVGANVVATGSGSINTTDLSFASNTNTMAPRVNASTAAVALGPAPSSVGDYFGFIGPTKFGTGAQFNADTSSGMRVSINGNTNDLFLPVNYESGTFLSTSTNTWNNKTIAGLGLTPGTYTWTWGKGSTSDTFVVTIVPEPASLVMLTLGLTAVAGLAWRHRKPRLAA